MSASVVSTTPPAQGVEFSEQPDTKKTLCQTISQLASRIFRAVADWFQGIFFCLSSKKAEVLKTQQLLEEDSDEEVPPAPLSMETEEVTE